MNYLLEHEYCKAVTPAVGCANACGARGALRTKVQFGAASGAVFAATDMGTGQGVVQARTGG